MAIDPAEKHAADYLLTLDPEERTAAAARINQLVKASAPPSDSEPPPPPIRNLGEYLEDKIEVPPFLVSNGQLVTGEITVLIARAGKGKTTFTMNRIIRWCAGLPLFEELEDSQVPTKPLKMLLVENEGAAFFMQEKLGLLLDHGASLAPEEQELARKNAMIWGDGGFSGLKIDRVADLEMLRRGCDLHEPDVLVMEPFRGIWTGEENDATAMEAVLDDLVTLGTEFGCAIMLAHHERKSGAGEDGEQMSRARGSGDLEGKVATMEHFLPRKDGALREVTWSKTRYAHQPSPPIRMAFNYNSWRYELIPEGEIAKAILGMMSEDADGWFATGDIADNLSEDVGKVLKALEGLKKEEDPRVVRRRQEKSSGYLWRLKQSAEDIDRGGLSV